MKKIFLYFLILIIVGVVAYQLGKKRNSLPNVNPNQEEGLFNCPYILDSGIYKEYGDSPNRTSVAGKPQLIDNPEIVKLNKPFNEQEFEKELYKLPSVNSKGWGAREFDVDDDDKDEMIINANIAMNHTPHIALVIKNGNIIFEANGPNVWIEGNFDGQGFILSETVDWITGEKKITRYLPKDGGFIPVWMQKSCLVKFE